MIVGGIHSRKQIRSWHLGKNTNSFIAKNGSALSVIECYDVGFSVVVEITLVNCFQWGIVNVVFL